MDKDYKQTIDKSTEAMNELESKIEGIASDFTQTATDLWGSFKTNFSDISAKLQDASENFSKVGEETTLQAHLGAMEARDKMESMKDDIEEFTKKVSEDAKVGFDEATLQAHLGKMEAEDFWEKKGPQITEEFKESAENVEKLAVEAIDEITSFFSKLVDDFKESEIKKH
jgi:gas vesicle protein